MSDTASITNTSSSEKPQPQFSIQAFYLRHLSLETGVSPRSLPLGVTPEMKLELRIQINPLEKEDEVVLDLTVTARDKSSLLYLIKIHQAGCFVLKEFTPEQKAFFLNTTCANLLYPYACQKANTLAVEAGFPPVNLLPIDFVHWYKQQQEQQAAQKIPSQDNSQESEPTPSTSSVQTAPQNKWANLAVSEQAEKETH